MISPENLGKKVEIEGRVSEIPCQHLIKTDTVKEVVYIDLDDGDQIVAYFEDKTGCAGRVRLEGTVIEVAGRSKRPGSDERFAEYQLDVLSWECIGDNDKIKRVLLSDLSDLENG